MRKNRRNLGAVCFLILLLGILGISAQAAGLNKTKASVNVKKTVALKVSGATGTVKWSSSNKKVATVSAKGVVKGKKKGTAVITAKAGKSAWKCKVTVKQPVTKVILNKTTSYVYAGGISHLKATCKPPNANNKKVTWKSSNPKIAKVSAKGVITGVRPGTVTITATAKDGSKKKAKCKVTVEKFEYYGSDLTYYIRDDSSFLEGIRQDGFWGNNLDGYRMGGGERAVARIAQRMETGETEPTYSFKSSNPSVVKVDSRGACTPVAGGKAVITTKITGGYNKGAVCKTPVTVTDLRIQPYLKKVDLTTANFGQYFGTRTIDRHDTWGEVTGEAVVLTNKKDAEGWYYYGHSSDFAVELNVQEEYSRKEIEVYEEEKTDPDGNTYKEQKEREVIHTDTGNSKFTMSDAHNMFYEGIFYKSVKENSSNVSRSFKGFQVTRVRGSIYLVNKSAVTKSEITTSTNGDSYQILTLKNNNQISLWAK